MEFDDASCTPPDLKQVAQEVSLNLLPPKSRDIYKKAYNKFTEWRITHQAPITENVILAYLKTLSATLKPPSLWSTYSFLKSTILLYNKINIATFPQVFQYLNRLSEGYKLEKAKILNEENVRNFLNTVPDEEFLAIKVSLIFGVLGALRIDELTNIATENFEQHGDIILVNIPSTKTLKEKSFTISTKYREVVQKYIDLRPKHTTTSRFFLSFRHGKCTVQPISKNKFLKMPSIIAKFLNLKNSELYTGHSFRRSSTSLLANPGACLPRIKRHGGWISDKVAESYIENSIEYKKNTEQLILSYIDLKDTTLENMKQQNLKQSTETNRLASSSPDVYDQAKSMLPPIPDVNEQGQETISTTSSSKKQPVFRYKEPILSQIPNFKKVIKIPSSQLSVQEIYVNESDSLSSQTFELSQSLSQYILEEEIDYIPATCSRHSESNQQIQSQNFHFHNYNVTLYTSSR